MPVPARSSPRAATTRATPTNPTAAPTKRAGCGVSVRITIDTRTVQIGVVATISAEVPAVVDVSPVAHRTW